MKNIAINLTVLILAILVFKSCSKDDGKENNVVDSSDIPSIKSAITNGDWHISYYFDSDKEETSDYVDYIFTFQENGTLGATDGNTSLSGAWSITTSDNSNDDTSTSDVDFNILFSSPEIFEELSDDWDIKSYSNNQIELMDISGGNGGTDLLTFSKN
ncbi:hypothetical protein [Maribacter halichondriae]|uniref:hypothetical protein n=1 Tax=Maribacter halichondriae TaxID=2980554 RepID=UPI002359FBBA|nr:hypothetical protein [Maribacter sp. Hal144]